MNLRAFGAVLWRRRLLVLLVLALVAVVVAVGLATQQKEYTAVARVAATPAQDSTSSPANYRDMLGTLADVAESRPVLADVQQAVGDRSLRQLQKEVRGSVVSGTVSIDVAVTDRSPRRAAQIANAVVAAMPGHDPSNGGIVLTTTQSAAIPLGYSKPDVGLVVLAGVLLALGLAVAVAVVWDRIARTVDTVDDAIHLAGVPVLGVLPRPDDLATVPSVPDTPTFNALRALRVALEFASREHPTRTLVVAAAGPNGWGGWLEVNLAVSLAEVGHRVLIIDADRHDGGRHPALDMPDAPGLYDLLAGTVSLDAATVDSPIEGVSVVPLGNASLASPTLLELRFRSFLEEIDEKYDVVLVHAAPVTESDDARVMAIGGGLLLALPVGRVKPSVLEQAATRLREVRIRVVGSVLLGRP
jgi:Mrp family chromosome partitioning ATPase/capsular polysaccharide biosynthesis protein